MPITCLPAALALALTIAPVLAQDVPPAGPTGTEAAEAAPAPNTSFALTFSGEWIGSADFDTSPGDVSITRLGANFGVRHPLNPRLALRFGAGVEHSVYDFSGATGLVAATDDPYDDVTISTLSLGGEYAPNDRNTWFFGGFVRSAGESGADFDDSISGGVLGGFRHAFSKDFSLGVGASVGTELEGDLYVVPFPMVEWQINERWRLASGDRAQLVLSFEASDAWTLGVRGGYERREYRLDDNGPLPSGVVDESRVPIALFVTYTASPNFIITGRVGTHLLNEFEFKNSADNRVSDDETDAALGVGIDLTVRF